MVGLAGIRLVGTVGTGTVGAVWDERDSFSNDISSFRASTTFSMSLFVLVALFDHSKGRERSEHFL